MSSIRPEHVANLRGLVTSGVHAKGTKSQRRAVFLETERGKFVLRRKDGPVFADTHLKRFVGHEVECDGYVMGTTLLAERIDVVKGE
jgi:hypothetical protein